MIAKDCHNDEANEKGSIKGSIKAIDQRSVHQICSGQVILSLATAVKELVENSIDSGANIVEIKLKDYGMDSIEVHDNGFGIEEKDFEVLARKHCTSKLRDFSDLAIVETFGFRGEALSSLCALSKLTVITRHSSKDFGSKLEFDYDGKLTAKTPCARETGTTMIINQLFHTLPVRHKEFQRNVKKEFPKLNSVLQAYGIINTGVRLSCTNTTDKNKKNVLLSTPGSDNFIENIASIFGPKQVENLLTFTQREPTEEILASFNVSLKSAEENRCIFIINGYISRIDHGCGRSSIDRQFYFINKRPCDIPKISRLVNEVYHMFNRNQNPFVFLDINLNSDMVDVNITPDKRQIFIQNEKLLSAILKTSLLQMFMDTAGQYEINSKRHSASFDTSTSQISDLNGSQISSVSSSPDQSKKQNFEKQMVRSPPGLSISTVLSNFRSKFAREQKIEPSPQRRQVDIERFTFAVAKDKAIGKTTEQNTKAEYSDGKLLDRFDLEQDMNHPSSSINEVPSSSIVSIGSSQQQESDEQRSKVTLNGNVDGGQLTFEKGVVSSARLSEGNGNKELDALFVENQTSEEDQVEEHVENSGKMYVTDENRSSLKVEFIGNYTKASNGAKEESEGLNGKSRQRFSCSSEDSAVKKSYQIDSESPADSDRPIKRQCFSRPEVQVKFNIEKLRDNLKLVTSDVYNESIDPLLGFHARIAPSQNNAAEDELRRNVTKEMFKDMEIIGQFNLGFIIAKIHDDLFIIDQHATDEKYNFETLQKEHCLKGQRLIQPRPLELTPVNEGILIEDLDIFRKNGFEFVIDENEASGHKVRLISLPTSRNWTFDVQDIEELIFMLSDNPGVMCRPSRVRSMFASRACRMSTMVGTALSRSQMKTLLNHMAEIEHPWNCPHGRPTMRHLVNLRRIGTQCE